jgi:outer membrane immunogenic protein
MKKMLLAGTALLMVVSGSAMAADLKPAPAPVYTKAPPMMPVPFSWTGCYIGGNGGGMWVQKTLTVTAIGTADGTLDASGGTAGGQIGCNYQVSAWVFGVQGDYNWASASVSSLDLVRTTLTDSIKVDSVASVTGRIGFAWDRFMLYFKGGWAWEKDEYTASTVFTTATLSDTRGGWTIGGGGEYAFLDWLTGFVEYDFYDFGTRSEALVGTLAPVLSLDVRETKSVAKAGLNFKFGGWH